MANKNVMSLEVQVEIDELPAAVMLYGTTVTPILQSEPGVGKSSVLAEIAKANGDQWRSARDTTEYPDDKYDYIYVDCPLKDLGDTGMHIPVHETKRLEYYASELFKLDSPKPKVIMLDEVLKAPKLLQVLFTRLMLERMAGDRGLPAGSIVFGTSNNQTDGVGDSMLAHAGNRVMLLKVRKPGIYKWLPWATENNISRSIRAWVAMEPRCLASYLDGGQDDNPYIFKPGNTVLSFVSPRSLALCDVVVRNEKLVSKNMFKAALAGTIGVSAAEALLSFIAMEKELIDVSEVIKNPLTVDMPDKPAALFLMMFNAVDTITTQDELSSFMQFVDRIPSSESKGIFYFMLMKDKRTVRLAKNNAQVNQWASKNLDMLV